ncbi:MAG: metallophosphoesterase [Patescibacteria group bacterium]|nr:metallophosphoesterase [Patescibacteria group bacterium]
MEILLSDLHISPFREEKFKTQKLNPIEWLIQLFADLLKKKEEQVFVEMMKIARERDITLGIVNGDLMESSATERGIWKETDYKAARKVKRWLEKLLRIKILLNMGNHESGYNLPLSSDPKAGISLKSLRNFLRLTGRTELYHSFELEGFWIVFIPYLFTEDHAVDFDIEKEKANFLKKMAKDFQKNEKIVVFTHDPDSLDDPGLRHILLANREKIKLFFCGHYHSLVTLGFVKALIAIFNVPILFPYRWTLRLLLWYATSGNGVMVKKIEAYFQKRKNIPRLMRVLNVRVIPGPTGMFGMGGGFLTVNLETLEVKRF